MSKKVLMKGNEAFAEAAIKSGCRYYFGYPITPQNEIPEYFSRVLKKAGGSFIQAESELAAVNMAYGAGAAGGRVLISSSSPGIALMQEGISFMASAQVPCVILNVSRGGPGVGGIQPSQADYKQATRGGGNGDYNVLVFAPASIQEAVDTISKSFELADRYLNPVMLLLDGMLGQMMEPVILPEPVEPIMGEAIREAKPWAIIGTKNQRKPNSVRSLFLQPEVLEERNKEGARLFETMKKEHTEYETIGLEEAEIVFVSYGSTSRIVKEAMEMLAKEGIKTGLIRPITLWPYPYEAFDQIPDTVKSVVSVELSQGQMMDDIKIGVKGRFDVDLCNHSGGILLIPEEIVAKAKKILEV